MRYGELLDIWESGYGRLGGWIVHLDGEPVGVLDDPAWEDMFWVSYRLQITTDDPSLAAEMATHAWWIEGPGVHAVYHSAAGLAIEPIDHALVGTEPVGPSRLNMRGLYATVRPPGWVDQPALLWRWLWSQLGWLPPRRWEPMRYGGELPDSDSHVIP